MATTVVEAKVAGRSHIYIADIATPTTLVHVGQQMDDTSIIAREFFNDVPGDSHGGPQGPPIERQALGRIHQCTFTLSNWSQEVREWLERLNMYAASGIILDEEIGTLLMVNHCWRLLIVGIKGDPDPPGDIDPANWQFTRNYPCALLSSPIEIGQGTKFSALRFTMEAHRAPVGAAKQRTLWDRDVTGYSAAIAAQEQAARARFNAMIEARTGAPPAPPTIQPTT